VKWGCAAKSTLLRYDWRFPTIVFTVETLAQVEQFNDCAVDSCLLNGLAASDDDAERQLSLRA